MSIKTASCVEWSFSEKMDVITGCKFVWHESMLYKSSKFELRATLSWPGGMLFLILKLKFIYGYLIG